MSIISHDTDAMREWSDELGKNTNSYDDLINRLYTLVENFTNSEDFKGGLSTEFYNSVINQKQMFLNYSDTFNECIKYINSKASEIDSDELALKNRINS